MTIPGSIITTIGLLLLYQETFDHFESWAYAWALIPTAVGVGIVIELLINISGTFDGVLAGTVVPLVLIGAGIYLFLRNPRWSAFGRPVTTENEAPAIEQHEDAGPSI